VLSAPPAFVLSQDQTLREEVVVTSTPRGRLDSFVKQSLKLKVSLSARASRQTRLRA
jgi:hypothetical protein